MAKQCTIDGSTYKIGHNNRPFILVNNEWMLSQKTTEEVEAMIAATDPNYIKPIDIKRAPMRNRVRK